MVRITKWLDPSEKTRTQYGEITNDAWLKKEAYRLKEKNIKNTVRWGEGNQYKALFADVDPRLFA